MSIRMEDVTSPEGDLYSKTLPSLVQRLETLSARLDEYDAALRSFSLDQLQTEETLQGFQDQASYFYHASGKFLETADAVNERLANLDRELLETHRLNMRNHLATYDVRCSDLCSSPSPPNLTNLAGTLQVLAIERAAIVRIGQASLTIQAPTRSLPPAPEHDAGAESEARESELGGSSGSGSMSRHEDPRADPPQCLYEPMKARPNAYEPISEFRSPGHQPTLRSEGRPSFSRAADPLFEGWMTKCGAFPRTWKCRYFRLFPDRLDYFLDDTSNTPKGTIPLLHGCAVLGKSECGVSWPPLAQRVPDDVCFGVAPNEFKRVFFLICAEEKHTASKDMLVANAERWKSLLRRDPSQPME
eukprot:m.225503 g.225503  ORF g.225503 m.225503 type:complete len:359 (+) comp16706_c0_seq1:919-1995(+)